MNQTEINIGNRIYFHRKYLWQFGVSSIDSKLIVLGEINLVHARTTSQPYTTSHLSKIKPC